MKILFELLPKKSNLQQKHWTHFAGNPGRLKAEMEAENCIFQRAWYQIGKTSWNDVISGSLGLGLMLFFSTFSC